MCIAYREQGQMFHLTDTLDTLDIHNGHESWEGQLDAFHLILHPGNLKRILLLIVQGLRSGSLLFALIFFFWLGLLQVIWWETVLWALLMLKHPTNTADTIPVRWVIFNFFQHVPIGTYHTFSTIWACSSRQISRQIFDYSSFVRIRFLTNTQWRLYIVVSLTAERKFSGIK